MTLAFPSSFPHPAAPSGYVFVPAALPQPAAIPPQFPTPPAVSLPMPMPAAPGAHGWIYIPPPPPTSPLPPPTGQPVMPLMSSLSPSLPAMSPPDTQPHLPQQQPLQPCAQPHQPRHRTHPLPSKPMCPRPAVATEAIQTGLPDAATQRAIDLDTRGCESEPGVVNVRLLLLKSRDMRRKLRAAMHHATRPRQLLNHNEAAKVQRRDHFAARLAAMERTARACGMLPPTPAMVSAQASAFRAQGRKHSSTGSSTVQAGHRASPPETSSEDGNSDKDDAVVWSAPDLVPLFEIPVTAAAMAPGAAAAACVSFEPNYAAALELFRDGHVVPATTRMEIHAALYRKFILSAAFHAARVVELTASSVDQA